MKKIFIIILFCLSGCALFKKTSKSSSHNSHKSINQLEASQLVLKTADKETQIFTYWNDSGFYQFQQIKEQIDQAELSKLKKENKEETQQKVTMKTTEPLNIWIYVVVLLGVLGLYWWKKYKSYWQ